MRPDLAGRYLLVAGVRERGPNARPPLDRAWRELVALAFRRWQGNAIRIPLGNDRTSVAQLRGWRRRAAWQPALVFPEGRARRRFGRVRPGSGRWLASLGAPVVPAGVWREADGGWRVRFGAAVSWSHRPDLRDLQLGLAIAGLLPAELAPDWQPALAAWHAAHQPAAGPCAAVVGDTMVGPATAARTPSFGAR
jgi:hypothetical protein